MDSDSIYWPENLPLPLADVLVTTTSRSEETQMDTGRVRHRRLVEDPWEILSVRWNFTDDEFDAFKTFFDTELLNGSLPFVLEVFGIETEVQFLEPNYQVASTDNLKTVIGRLCSV